MVVDRERVKDFTRTLSKIAVRSHVNTCSPISALFTGYYVIYIVENTSIYQVILIILPRNIPDYITRRMVQEEWLVYILVDQ